MPLMLQDFIVQETSRFFHERGMEPSISFKNGIIDFNMPPGWTPEDFHAIMNELQLHLQQVAASVGL